MLRKNDDAATYERPGHNGGPQSQGEHGVAQGVGNREGVPQRNNQPGNRDQQIGRGEYRGHNQLDVRARRGFDTATAWPTQPAIRSSRRRIPRRWLSSRRSRCIETITLTSRYSGCAATRRTSSRRFASLRSTPRDVGGVAIGIACPREGIIIGSAHEARPTSERPNPRCSPCPADARQTSRAGCDRRPRWSAERPSRAGP